MRDHGIAHIVETILDAPENAAAVNEIKERVRQAGFKAGYNECLSHVNPFYKSRFTDERSGLHGVDSEAAYAAAIMWTVCGCCLTDRRRRKPLVVRRMMQVPVVQKRIRLACVPCLTSFLM
ncbi:hypothetical protein Hanom_Chr04g00307501 [Helianthus anomalus]